MLFSYSCHFLRYMDLEYVYHRLVLLNFRLTWKCIPATVLLIFLSRLMVILVPSLALDSHRSWEVSVHNTKK